MLPTFLSDPNGVKSTGRLIAACLVVIGVLAYPTGLFMPHMAAYAAEFTGKCFTAASVFYGTTKGYDTLKGAREKLMKWFGKDAGTSAPTPTTESTTPASPGE